MVSVAAILLSMMLRWLPLLANLLVVVYALDGCLSLLEAVVRAGTGSQALLGLRNAFAIFVFCTGIAYVPSTCTLAPLTK